jgi:hypothetical protein
MPKIAGQWCSETSLQMKLMSGERWALFLQLYLVEAPAPAGLRPYGYLPYKWQLQVLAPGRSPQISIHLRSLYAREDTSKIPWMSVEGLAQLRAGALGQQPIWNDEEETFLVRPRLREMFLLQLPVGTPMLATMFEGEEGGTYHVVDAAQWKDVVPPEAVGVIAALEEPLKRANWLCDQFWSLDPLISPGEYARGVQVPRNLSLVLDLKRGWDLVCRPVLADPTTSHDGAVQPWAAKKWVLGWRLSHEGSEDLQPIGTRSVSEEMANTVAVFEQAVERINARIRRQDPAGFLCEKMAWF